MDFIKVHLVKERVYMLEENPTGKTPVTMMLVIGTQRAAILDTGFGYSDSLLRHIRSLTEKPILCLLTHCDPDHVGGASLFDDIYMNPLDAGLMKGALRPFARLKLLESVCDAPAVLAFARENILQADSFRYHSLRDGDSFDLGEVRLEAVALPGHTRGSMCFINREEGYAFTGDSIANLNSPVLFFDKSQPLEIYMQSLARFMAIAGPEAALYTGHDIHPLARQVVPEIQALCRDILGGDTGQDTPYLPPFMAAAGEPPKGYWAAKLQQVATGLVSRKQLGDSQPMEHSRPEFVASVKYNANRLHA